MIYIKWHCLHKLTFLFLCLIHRISFALWLVTNLMLCAVPRYAAYCFQLTGLCLLATNIIYALLLPKRPLLIPFETGLLRFQFGTSFWLVASAGILSLVVGSALALLDTLFPQKFSTILQLHYDTPYPHYAPTPACAENEERCSCGCDIRRCTVLDADCKRRGSSVSGRSLNAASSGRGSALNSHSIASQSLSTRGHVNEAFEPENMSTKSDLAKQLNTRLLSKSDQSEPHEDLHEEFVEGKRAVSLQQFSELASAGQLPLRDHNNRIQSR